MNVTRLTHDALFYADDTEFTAALGPFIRDGLAHGDALICAVTRGNIEVLQAHLGGDADRLTFIDRDEWYRRPAATIAGWQRLLGEAMDAGHGYVRIVGEVAFGEADRHPTWTRYESALNELFAAAPAWIVCPYNTRTLAPQVLSDAMRTHAGVFDPVRRPSDDFQPTRELFAQITETLPEAMGALAVEVVIDDLTGLPPARQAVTRAAAATGAEPQRIEELQLVVSELVGNSLRHGAGKRRLCLWISEHSFTGEVTDEGDGFGDPLAGYQAPGTGTAGGWGLWLSQQLCDQLAIVRDNGITRVRFRIGR